MHIPAPDRANDESEWRTFIESHGFGHLVAGGRARPVPVVVPTQFLLDDDKVLLHLARPNPLFDAIAEQPRVLLSVAGDWAFIPSSWKAVGDEDPLLGIPTTYYAAVQLEGDAVVVDEPSAIAAILRRQLDALQPTSRWPIRPSPTWSGSARYGASSSPSTGCEPSSSTEATSTRNTGAK